MIEGDIFEKDFNCSRNIKYRKKSMCLQDEHVY